MLLETDDLAAVATRPCPPAVDDAELLEDFAYRYGRTYDSYLATEPDREYFSSRSAVGGVAFVRLGKYLTVAGGLLAPAHHKPALLAELVEHARRRRWFLSFYNIPEDELPLFRAQGFQMTRWGGEAIVDLADLTCQGGAFQWVRRQANYCLRKGVVVSECCPQSHSTSSWDRLCNELHEVAAQSLADKPQTSEIRLLEGQFDPTRLGRKRLFLARSSRGRGRIEGFLVCNPGMNGALWALELYRRRDDAVRGTIAFLMRQTMELLRREGVARVSLGLLPGLDCGQPREGDSKLARWGIVCGTRYFNFIFDTTGTAYFKTRFRPRIEHRYVCTLPGTTLGSLWAFIRVLGVLRIDLRRLLRQVIMRRPNRRSDRRESSVAAACGARHAEPSPVSAGPTAV